MFKRTFIRVWIVLGMGLITAPTIAAPPEIAEWVEVESSNLAAVRYFAETRHLEIRFSRGDVYRFSNVPAPLYAELLAAESPGTFFRTRIQGRYPSERITRACL